MRTPLHPARAFLSRFGRMHVILPVSVLNSAAYTIIGLGLVFYMRDRLAAGAAAIGLASATFNALYFVGCFVLRPVGLRMMPRYSLVVSSAVAVALLSLLLTANSIAAVILLYGAVGFTLALFWPPIMGWLSAALDGRQLNSRISHFNLAWSAGVIVGPLAAGFLAQWRLESPLVVGSVLIAIVGGVVLLASIFLSEIRADTHRDRRAAPGDAPDASTALRYPAWIGLVSSYVVLGALMVIVPLHARDAIGLAEGAVGILLLSRGLAAAIGFWALGVWAGWHGRPFHIVAAQLAMVPLLIALMGAGSLAAYAIVLPLVGLAVAASYTFSVYYGVAGASDRTRRMAIHEALLTVGSVGGALMGGRLYEASGARAAYLGAIIVVGVAVGAELVIAARLRGGLRRPEGNAPQIE
ncbi:MAG: MFS transporter [Spirochaetaceae bacterium]|nr:MAG: MFS transporter [Spirochaetaceae bacterium]